MTKDEIEQAIRRILVEDFRIAADRIVPDATLRGTLGLDSMDAIDFLLLVNKEFGIAAEIDDYRNLAHLEDLVGFVQRKQSANG